MAYRDEDSILDQIYQLQIFPDSYYVDLKPKSDRKSKKMQKYKDIQHSTTRN